MAKIGPLQIYMSLFGGEKNIQKFQLKYDLLQHELKYEQAKSFYYKFRPFKFTFYSKDLGRMSNAWQFSPREDDFIISAVSGCVDIERYENSQLEQISVPMAEFLSANPKRISKSDLQFIDFSQEPDQQQ